MPIQERWRDCADRSCLRSSPGLPPPRSGRAWRCVLLWPADWLLSRGRSRPITSEEHEMSESVSEVPSGELVARLDAGPVICAEGFLFELERRGYLSAGEFVPEVALEHPDALRTLHVDFQRAGSDVVEAFT